MYFYFFRCFYYCRWKDHWKKISQSFNSLRTYCHIWPKLFENGPSKISGRQPLKNLKWYGLLKADHLTPNFLKTVFTNLAWSILEHLVPNILLSLPDLSILASESPQDEDVILLLTHSAYYVARFVADIIYLLLHLHC